MYSVTKEFTFDSAHRLVNGYQGKCRNIHGHTWRVRLTVAGDHLDQFGFLRDFGDFKPVKEYIDQHIDHAMLVSQDDESMLAFCVAQGQKHYRLPGNPTSELLAKHIYFLSRQHCNIPVTAVEIDETCTCSARFAP